MHEIRNINVHNDGIVNSIFLDRIKFEIGINYSKGKFLNVGWDDYTKMTNIVVKEVLNFDRQARKKFGLPTIRIS